MRIAIIDLGTNTINLLIAEISSEHSYQIILETKCPAKLGKGGINNRTILPDAMERGMQALKTHLHTVEDYQVDKTVCIATAAMRNAENAKDFIDRVKETLGLDIRVINGHDEAQLIFDGVKQVVPIGDQRVLILDIGGGVMSLLLPTVRGFFGSTVLIWE